MSAEGVGVGLGVYPLAGAFAACEGERERESGGVR